ncbi:hypothetical protein FO519_008524 [Halicephalobus sp. NKZ332]|nr:hypothetical protein FO519_008524 [Halicephalobus sp. NKZ332]
MDLADEVGILCMRINNASMTDDSVFTKDTDYPKAVNRNRLNSTNLDVIDELQTPQDAKDFEIPSNIKDPQAPQIPLSHWGLEEVPSKAAQFFTFSILVSFFFSYLIFGTVMFQELDPTIGNRTFYKAFMLPLQTCLTIGWGNFPILTPTAQLFCILYALIGVPLCHTTLTRIGQSLYNIYVPDWLLNSAALRQIPGKKEKIVTFPLLSAIKFLCVFHIVGLILFNVYFHKFGIVEALYFDFFTSGFIGFGDIIPDPANFLQSFVLFFYLPSGGIFQAIVNACFSYHFQRLFYNLFKNWLYRLHLKSISNPTDDGDHYFINRSTGESTWEHPSDSHYKKMVEEWRSNKVVPRGQQESSTQKTPSASKMEVLSDEEEKVYSSDSMTFGSPEEDEGGESDEGGDDSLSIEDTFGDKDKEFFISSPRLRPNMEDQKSFESSGDDRKKVTFSKHLVKVYEFDDGNLQWKRSNLFRKQNSGENEKSVIVKELEDGGIEKDKQTAGERPGTPLIVPTERYRRLKQVQRRADTIVYRNWREFCTVVTESYVTAYQLATSIPSKKSPNENSSIFFSNMGN